MDGVFEVAKAELESLKSALEAHIAQLVELREYALNTKIFTLFSGAKHVHLGDAQSFQLGVELVDTLLLNSRSKLTTVTQEIAKLSKPEPKTIFNTANEWFDFEELPEDYEDRLQRFGDDLQVAVCTSDEWYRYTEAGKEGQLSYYGNNNGSQGISQIIDAVNDIGAGLRVSGDPCDAVIIIRRSE